MKRHKVKYPFWWYFFRWVSYLIQFFESIGSILTLGFWQPRWSLNLAFYTAKRHCKWSQKRKKK